MWNSLEEGKGDGSAEGQESLGTSLGRVLLGGSDTKNAELLARFCLDQLHERDCPQKCAPKACQMDCANAGQWEMQARGWIFFFHVQGVFEANN